MNLKLLFFIVLMSVLAPVLLFAQKEKARERIKVNNAIAETTTEYVLVASTMQRWLREEGRIKKPMEGSNVDAARHEVQFVYTTTKKPARNDKNYEWVTRHFRYEWVHKNNLIHFKRLRRSSFLGKNDMWDFKARSFFVGRKVKELYADKDTTGMDVKVLAFSRVLPFLPRGIVVLTEKKNGALIKNYTTIAAEIKKHNDYYPENATLVVYGTWERHAIH